MLSINQFFFLRDEAKTQVRHKIILNWNLINPENFFSLWVNRANIKVHCSIIAWSMLVHLLQ